MCHHVDVHAPSIAAPSSLHLHTKCCHNVDILKSMYMMLTVYGAIETSSTNVQKCTYLVILYLSAEFYYAFTHLKRVESGSITNIYSHSCFWCHFHFPLWNCVRGTKNQYTNSVMCVAGVSIDCNVAELRRDMMGQQTSFQLPLRHCRCVSCHTRASFTLCIKM